MDTLGATMATKPSDVELPAPGLTCCELLQAALMLKKHVALLNDPFSCKLEVMLSPVGIV